MLPVAAVPLIKPWQQKHVSPASERLPPGLVAVPVIVSMSTISVSSSAVTLIAMTDFVASALSLTTTSCVPVGIDEPRK
jgi:hypothetical protein